MHDSHTKSAGAHPTTPRRRRRPQGDLKKHTVASLEEYVHRDERLPMLLDRLRENGVKTFLLTNSEFWYTEAIMTYLLNFDTVSGRRVAGSGSGEGYGGWAGVCRSTG